MMPILCTCLGTKVYTNHSIRGTGIRLLKKAGFDDRVISKVSGHKSVQSLNNYDADLGTKRKILMAKALGNQITRGNQIETGNQIQTGNQIETGYQIKTGTTT